MSSRLVGVATGFKARVTVDIDLPGASAPRTKATPTKAKTETTAAAQKAPVAKKQKAENASASSAKGAATATTAKKPKAEGPAAARGVSSATRGGKKATGVARSNAGSGPSPAAESSKPRPNQTVKRNVPLMGNNPSYRPQPHSPSPDMMDPDDPDGAPPPYDSLGFDTYDNPPSSRSEQSASVQITGHYDVEIDVDDSDFGGLTPRFVLVVDTN